ncbi:Retinoic acid receptor responder protein 3 [Takifugu flavidus]|uniref:Retinoic acid receptor responder protein 3 n=1 Tax=Takifugu flavidus TaxID=433684 RepID=A0A5C6MKG3_9TELE|nr:Retinoic acid receptor responder protein 3 [Takifugu flavidus]
MAPVLYDENPEPGDLIEICRGSYQHWAVYVGDGFVVHLTVTSEGWGGSSSSSGLDNKYEPRPSDIIVKAACELVGQQRLYHLLTKNCEHFVNDLRYGKAESRQGLKAAVMALAAGVVAAVSPVVLVVGIVALVGALFGGSKKSSS